MTYDPFKTFKIMFTSYFVKSGLRHCPYTYVLNIRCFLYQKKNFFCWQLLTLVHSQKLSEKSLLGYSVDGIVALPRPRDLTPQIGRWHPPPTTVSPFLFFKHLSVFVSAFVLFVFVSSVFVFVFKLTPQIGRWHQHPLLLPQCHPSSSSNVHLYLCLYIYLYLYHLYLYLYLS